VAVAAPPSTTCAVTTYAERVVAGDVVVGRLVRLACERHLRDLELGQLRGLWFDHEEAERVYRFFRGLKHSKGEWAGESFELADWQMFIVGSAFGWKRADGTRRFRTIYSEVARKNGKTTLVAGAALYATFADGEAGAEGYIAATKRDQARICWDEAMRMVKATPALAKRVRVLEARGNLSNPETASKLEPLARDADSLDGLNPHFAGVDELHAHPTREMVDVLETAVGARRQPLIWYITTAGFNQASVWWEKRSYAVNVVDGTADDDSLFVFIATLDAGDDWRDEAVWPKANPNLGVSVKLDTLREEARKAEAIPGQQNAFRCKRLNQPVEQAERWLDMARWDACDAEPQIAPGQACFLGLDLSSTTDITAAVAVFPADDGCYDVQCHFWMPEVGVREREQRDGAPYRAWMQQGYITATEGDIVDYDVIRETVKVLAETYEITEIPYDPWNATQLATQLGWDGATVVPMSQGYASLSEASKFLESLVITGRLRHGGHPVLRWMAANVAVKQGPNDSIRPVKGGLNTRIDGIVALVMGLGRVIAHMEPHDSVYEARGVFRL
jgi:phage terminase large subunit-like protein